MKFLKFLISALVIIILLIIIAAVALPFIINPNDFKPQITEQVKKATGRELTLGGDINLSFFPWLGVELHKVSLSNAPGFRDIPFAKADTIEIRVELMPLLQKRLVMDTVVLKDLGLNLARNAQGKTNWDDLVAKSSQETPGATKTPAEDTPSGEAAPLAAIAIAGLKIEAAQAHWRDEVENVSYAIEQLNLTTDSFAPGEPTNVKLGFDFTSSQPEARGHVDFGGEVTADMETNHYQVQDTALSLTVAGPALPVEQLALKLGADIDAFLAKQQLNISDLNLTSQVKKGPQEVQLVLTTSLAGDLAARQYQLKALQLKTRVTDPQFPKPLNASLATTTANLDLNKGTFALQDLSLAALGIQVNGHLNGVNILTEPHLKGQLVSNQFNPLQVAQALAIELPPAVDTSAPGKARLAMKFAASPKDFALNLGANIEALLARQQLNTSDPKSANRAKGTREAQLTLVTSLKGDLVAQQYQLKNLQLKTQIKDPQFPKLLNASLATTGTADLKQETLALQDINMTALGMQLNGHLNGVNILTEPHLKGQFVSNKFNPRQIAQALAIELPPTADSSVLNKAHLDLKFSASPRDFDAPRLAVTLDDSTLRGDLAVHNFQQPAIRFDLALNGINVDRYLPPPPPPSEKEARPIPPPVTPGGGAAAGASQLPLETLRTLNVGGTLKIGKLTAGGVHSKDIRITLNARDGLIKLHPLQAKLYQGTYAGNIQLDARSEPLKFAIDENLTGIKAGPLLKDLMGDDKVLGTANINAKLTATGATPETIRHTLNGTAGFSFTDGAVKGINIPQLIREAMARIEGKPLPPTNEPKQTDFAMLQGTITAENGLLKNNDLVAKSPLLRVHGQGTADLVQEAIDYQLKVSVVKSLEGQGGGTLADLRDITIPLKISGTFTKLDYGIDVEGLVKAKAKKLIDKNLDKGLNKLLGTEPGKEGETSPGTAPTPQEQLKQELKNRLKDFF